MILKYLQLLNKINLFKYINFKNKLMTTSSKIVGTKKIPRINNRRQKNQFYK